jgi:3-phosphoinositide dependent protein kinase-1
VAAEVINILEYLNMKGLAHRDLKPANLLLDENFHIKLVDFGTSKILDPKLRKNTERRPSVYVQM